MATNIIFKTAKITVESALDNSQTALKIYEKLPLEAKVNTWGDANGFSHIKAALKGPSLTIPFKDGKLLLGTWQQVVLTEFDIGPRQRQVVVQIIGQ